jgi:hypothetical protein
VTAIERTFPRPHHVTNLSHEHHRLAAELAAARERLASRELEAELLWVLDGHVRRRAPPPRAARRRRRGALATKEWDTYNVFCLQATLAALRGEVEAEWAVAVEHLRGFSAAAEAQAASMTAAHDRNLTPPTAYARLAVAII